LVRLFATTAIAMALGLFTTAQAEITVLNDTFDGPSYIDFFFNDADSSSNPADVSSAFYSTTVPAGGNPGSYGELIHSHDVDRDEFGDPINFDGFVGLQSFFSEQTASYTPLVEGDIASITLSLDVRTSDPIDSLFFEISDANGGSVANGGSGFLPITSDGQWNTYALSGVMQDGAAGRDFAGSLPLNFGFGFTSSADVFEEPVDYTIDVDNFVVQITPVPEPSSLALLSLSGLVALRRRR